jgi:hypothetical protein
MAQVNPRAGITVPLPVPVPVPIANTCTVAGGGPFGVLPAPSSGCTGAAGSQTTPAGLHFASMEAATIGAVATSATPAATLS